jgi:cell division protease FtsH
MPLLILEALENDINEIDLSYKDNNLVAENKKAKFVKKIKCIGTIDSIKSENDLDNDRRIKTSIHEAAHAVVYAKLFEISPTQIDANTASDRNSGFIGIHNFVHSKNTTLDVIKVYMAGTAIESIVFGEDSISNGASADIIAATKIASQGIKEWGFFNNNSYIRPESVNQGLYANNNNSGELNNSIEQLVSQQKEKVTELLEANMDLVKEVADYLFINYSIEPVVFKDICQKHGLNIEVRDAKYTIHEKYWQKYDEFFNKSRNDKKYVTSKINYPMLKLAADKNEEEKTEEITDEK